MESNGSLDSAVVPAPEGSSSDRAILQMDGRWLGGTHATLLIQGCLSYSGSPTLLAVVLGGRKHSSSPDADLSSLPMRNEAITVFSVGGEVK